MWDKRCCRAVWCSALVLGSCYFLWRLIGCPGPPLAGPTSADDFVINPNYLPLVPTNVTSAPPPYPLHVLPSQDPSSLVDLKEFAFLSPLSCPTNSTPLVVAIVHSAPSNIGKRDAIRSTWGTAFKLVFMVGETNSSEQAALLDQEIKDHGDIVQGNFQDSYRNLTYKHVMALKWVSYRCRSAIYLLKTDDDVFVHTSNLYRFLHQRLTPLGARRLILCQVNSHAIVHRSYRSKWRVAPYEYVGSYYPNYCTGSAIVYSPDVVFKLYSEAQKTPYFWIDDVHITGTVASIANITHTDIGPLLRWESNCQKMMEDGRLQENLLFCITESPENIKGLWKIHETAQPTYIAGDGAESFQVILRALGGWNREQTVAMMVFAILRHQCWIQPQLPG